MKYFFKVLIVLYIIVGTVPNLESLDKVVTQWLYLNLVNSIGLFFLILKGYSLKEYFFNKTSVLFFCLFFWSITTVFFAINPIESIVVLSQLFAIIVAFVIIMVCVTETNDAFKFIANALSIFLIIELIRIYLPFKDDIDPGLLFSRSNLFLGFAANVNITAFSVLYKVPFLLYSLSQIKKLKIIFYPLAFLIFSLIFFSVGTLNATRGAIITYSLLSPILLIIGFVVYFKRKDSKLLLLSTLYSLSLLFTFQLNSYLSNKFEKTEYTIGNRLSAFNALIDNQEVKDQSTTQRINFYSQALHSIKEKPIFGVGLGNWKIASIDYDKENIIGYQVPYHVHNDYLEIGAEIGLIGLGIYLAILFFGFNGIILNFTKDIFTKRKLNANYFIYITISLFIFIFIIDSNINFPFHRPILLINLIILLAFLNSTKSRRIYE